MQELKSEETSLMFHYVSLTLSQPTAGPCNQYDLSTKRNERSFELPFLVRLVECSKGEEEERDLEKQ